MYALLVCLHFCCVFVAGFKPETGYLDQVQQVYKVTESVDLILKLGLGTDLEFQDEGTFPDGLTNIQLLNMVSDVMQNVDISNASNCYLDILQTLATFTKNPIPVLELLDAQGIGPIKGSLLGNTFNLGNYQECIRSQVKLSANRSYTGMYCGVESMKLMEPLGLKIQSFRGYCVPNSCTDNEFKNIMKFGDALSSSIVHQNVTLDQKLVVDVANFTLDYFLDNKTDNISTIIQDLGNIIKYDYQIFMQIYDNSSVASFACHRPLVVSTDPLAIFVICVLSLIWCLMLLGTLYDYFLYQPAVADLPDSGDPNSDDPIEGLTRGQYYDSQPLALKCLMAFSVYTNFPKLFDTTRREGTLNCIHGMRFISMTWVILGHVYAFTLSYMDNPVVALEQMKNFSFQALMNASVSVDTFFLISGLLLSYLWFKETTKKDGRNIKSVQTWIMYYVHRYIRLTPVYMLIIAVSAALVRYISDSPFWLQEGDDLENCKYWWKNLFYIQNYWDDPPCMGVTWYLAIDMQLYAMAPPFLVITYFFPQAGLGIAVALIFASSVARGYVTGTNNGSPLSAVSVNFTRFTSQFFSVYEKPWMRLGPYVVGMIVGYLLFQTIYKNKSFKMNRLTNLAGWLIATGLALTVLYGMYDVLALDKPLPAGANGLYSGVGRTVWAIAVGWVCFACCTGYGGIVDLILSWKVWIPLSRLTYCAYLTHLTVFNIWVTNRSQPLRYDGQLSVIFIYFGVLVGAYGASLVFSLMLEGPVLILEKLLIPNIPSSISFKVMAEGRCPEVTPENDSAVSSPTTEQPSGYANNPTYGGL